MLDVEEAIRDYLPNIIHMSLATCVGNKPWVCEVHFAYDKELNLYFRSTLSRRHSQEIEQNPTVAGNIISQHQLSDKPRGVYFEGTAKLLENVDEDHVAYKMISSRFNLGNEILEDAKLVDGHKFYEIKVGNFYVFDARETDPSKKYHLHWIK